MHEKEHLKLSPQLILTAVLRRKALFLMTVIVCMGAAAVIALRMKFQYEAGAQILVKPGGREGFSLESAALRGTPIVDRQAYTDIANTLAILQSRSLIDRLVDRIMESEEDISVGLKAKDVDKTKSQGEDALSTWIQRLLQPPEYKTVKSSKEMQRDLLRIALARSVTIEQISGTSIVELVVRWDDPYVAYRIANLLLDECRKHYQEFYHHKEAIAFLETLVKETQEKQQEIIKKEDNLRVQFKVADVEIEIDQVLEQIGTLEEEFTQCRMESASAFGRSGVLTDMMKGLSPLLDARTTTTINPKWTTLYNNLQTLKLRKMETRILRGQKSKIEEEIDRVQKELAKEPMVIKTEGPAAPNPVYTRLQQERMTLEANTAGSKNKCTAISEQIQALKLRHDNLQRVSKVLQGFALERTLVEDELRNHLRNLSSFKTADQLARGHISSMRVIEKPELNTSPLKNRKPMALAGGIAIGILLGIGLCVLLMVKGREISSSGQLKKVAGLKVIGAIPTCRYTSLLKPSNHKLHRR